MYCCTACSNAFLMPDTNFLFKSKMFRFDIVRDFRK
jgi:hypothetical protein